MCAHDPQYTISNESAGGVGCAKCNADRAAVKVVAALEREAARPQLTSAEIAMLEARTAETASAEEYSSATEGHW